LSYFLLAARFSANSPQRARAQEKRLGFSGAERPGSGQPLARAKEKTGEKKAPAEKARRWESAGGGKTAQPPWRLPKVLLVDEEDLAVGDEDRARAFPPRWHCQSLPFFPLHVHKAPGQKHSLPREPAGAADHSSRRRFLFHASFPLSLSFRFNFFADPDLPLFPVNLALSPALRARHLSYRLRFFDALLKLRLLPRQI
jgi:hypothetical protein